MVWSLDGIVMLANTLMVSTKIDVAAISVKLASVILQQIRRKVRHPSLHPPTAHAALMFRRSRNSKSSKPQHTIIQSRQEIARATSTGDCIGTLLYKRRTGNQKEW